MKRSAFSFLVFLSHAALVCLVITSGAETGAAQATRNINSSARRVEEFNKQSENVSRDQMRGEMGAKKPTPEELRRAKAANAQITEDLEALQSGYNEIVGKLQSKETVTNAFLVETGSRIHKHASRLRSLIKFPELNDAKPGESIPNPDQPVSARKQLVELCNHILAFFESPMLQNPTVLDVQKAEAARQILDRVIQKSAKIKSIPE